MLSLPHTRQRLDGGEAVVFAGPRPSERQHIPAVHGIEDEADSRLFQVAHTGNVFCPLACLPEGGQEESCKDRDNGDHHQQFNNGKRPHSIPDRSVRRHPVNPLAYCGWVVDLLPQVI